MTWVSAPGAVTSSVLAGLPAVVDPEVTPQDGGSPGVLGFVFTFVLALALIALALSLARQLRKVDHNARAAGDLVASESSVAITPQLSDATGAEGGGSQDGGLDDEGAGAGRPGGAA